MARKTILSDEGILSAIDKLGEQLEQNIIDTVSKKVTSGTEKGIKEANKKLKATKAKLEEATVVLEKVAVEVDDESLRKEAESVINKSVKNKPIKVNPKVEVDAKLDNTSKLQKQVAVDLQKIVSRDPIKLEVDLMYITNSKGFNNGNKQAIQKFVATYAAYLEKTGKDLQQYRALYDGYTNPGAYKDGNDKIDTVGKRTLEFYTYLTQEVKNLNAALTETAKLQEQVSSPTKSKPDKNPVLSGDEIKNVEQLTEVQKLNNKTLEERVSILKEMKKAATEWNKIDAAYSETPGGWLDSSQADKMEELEKKFNQYKIRVKYADGSEGKFDTAWGTTDYDWATANEEFRKQIDLRKKIVDVIFEEVRAQETLNQKMADEKKSNKTSSLSLKDNTNLSLDEKIEKTEELIKLGKILSTQSRVTELQNDPDITDEQEDELQRLEQALGEADYAVEDFRAEFKGLIVELKDGTSITATTDSLEKLANIKPGNIKNITMEYTELFNAVSKFESATNIFDAGTPLSMAGSYAMRGEWGVMLDELSNMTVAEFKQAFNMSEEEATQFFNKVKLLNEKLWTDSGMTSDNRLIDNLNEVAEMVQRKYKGLALEVKASIIQIEEAAESSGKNVKDYVDDIDFWFKNARKVIDAPITFQNQTEVLSSNKTPLSSTQSNAGEEAKEEAQQIEQADEQIEGANEEVEQSEEELAQETVESRDKAAKAAKEQAKEVEKANARIAESNKKAAQSEQNPLNTSSSVAGLEKEAEAMKEVVDSAKKAAQAKDDFADSNKKVKASAEASTPSIEGEAEAFTLVPMTDEWNNAVETAKKYTSVLGEVYEITRKIRRGKSDEPLISYQLTGENGNSITVGKDGGLISLTEKTNTEESRQYSDDYAIAMAQAAENVKRENDYLEERNRLLAEGKKQAEEYYKQRTKINADWDEAIRLNNEFDKNQQYSSNLARAMQDAAEYEARERAYEEQRKKSLAEGIKQEDAYYKKKSEAEKKYSDWWNTALDKKAVQDRETSEKQQEVEFEKATKQNKDAVTAYERLYDEANKYYTLLAKQKSGQELTNKEGKELEALTKEFYEASEGVGKYAKALDNLGSKESKNRYDNIRSNFLQDSAQSYLDNLKVDIDKSADKFVMGTANKRALDFVDEYKSKVKELETVISTLKEKQEQGIDLVNSKELGDVAQLLVQVEQLETELRRMKNNKEYYIDLADAWDKVGKISQTLDKNTNMPKALKEQFKALQQEYEIVINTKGSQKRVEELNVELSKLNAQLQASHKTGKSFFDLVATKAHHMAAQFFAMYLSFQDLLRIGKQAYQYVLDIDKQMIELEKVSDMSTDRLAQSFEHAAEAAKDLGATISDVLSATADWSRLGYDADAAEELAEIATIYKNVGDGIDIDTANKSLISTLRGFQMEASQAMEIVDSFNEVANRMPIDSAGIGEALQRSAAAFNAAKTDLNSSISLITATNSVLQSPEKVGRMWATVSARIRGAKQELIDAGEETDGMVESTSKLRDLVKAATGFDIMVDENTFKDMKEIIVGIGKEWDKLSDIDQAGLLEALAGKQQSNALAAALSNYEMIEEAYEIAENSAGSAMREQEKWEQGLEARTNKLKASLEELSTTMLDSDFLGGAIDSGRTFIEVLTVIIDKLGVIPTVLTGVGAVLGAKSAIKGDGK